MARLYSKGIIIFIIIAYIFVSSNYIQAYQVQEFTNSTLKKNDTIDNEPFTINNYTPFENDLSINVPNEEDYIYSQPIRITPSSLIGNDYTVAQGPDGIIHCIWVKKSAQFGENLYYSHSYDQNGENWSEPISIYRSLWSIKYTQLIVDNNNTLHLFYINPRNEFYGVFYLRKEYGNDTVQVESIYSSMEYKFSELQTVLTLNNTITVAWVSTSDNSSSIWWESRIVINRLNITTGEWMPSLWILYDIENPVKMDLSSDYDKLEMVWSKSDDYSSTQELMYSCYNETSESWVTETELLQSDKIIHSVTIKSSTTSNNTHVFWVKEEPSTYKLNYVRCLTNGTITNTTINLNPNTSYAEKATLFEDLIGNIHLIMEDKVGYYQKSFYRIYFNSNDTWGETIQITQKQESFGTQIIPINNSTTNLAILFYIAGGSLYQLMLNQTFRWTNEHIIYFGAQRTLYPSAVVDSEGVTHMVCLYLSTTGGYRLMYLRKKPIEIYWSNYTILTDYLSLITAPKIFIDLNETLHVFYYGYDSISKFYALFYMYKEKNSSTWSIQAVVDVPVGDGLMNFFIRQIQEFEIEAVFDSENTMHVFWRQFDTDGWPKICYSSKKWDESTFTTTILFPDTIEESFPYHINAIVDRNDTIHLVFAEISVHIALTAISYCYKEKDSDWVDPETLSASYDYLFRPTLVEFSTGIIRLYYTINAEVISWYDFYDSELLVFEKGQDNTNWYYKGSIMGNYGTSSYFDIVLLADDSFFLIYYYTDYSSPYYWREHYEELRIAHYYPNGTVGPYSALFNLEHDKAVPIGLYNNYTDKIMIIHQYDTYTNWYEMQNDTDGDLIGDLDEAIFCTDLNDSDTDNDGLSDGYEVITSLSNPIVVDSDWDGLSDYYEEMISFSNPLSIDTDRDGITDGDEVLIYNSNPSLQDSDGDQLSDYVEIVVIGSNPNSNDTDSDLMPDLFEYLHGLNLLVDDSGLDPDADDLVNLGEYYAGTDLYNYDTDSDLLSDGQEVNIYFTNPLLADTDSDTLTDWEEIMKYHTNPFSADSDGDGFSDRDEINAGTDPNNPKDNVRLRRLRTILYSSIIPISVLIIVIVIVETNYRIKSKRIKEAESEELSKEKEIIAELESKH
ncbi:MAG: hypothetical protein FK734_01430 [Asgard group archaeon]|nr:hypothetical protein [Asgard group archaeon]